LIRHAVFQTAAVLALTIPMIETPFGALLMTAVGFAALEVARFFAATGAAITLATITVTAQIKHRTAGRKVAETLAKEFGTGKWHRFGWRALDNRRRSCQHGSRQ
jgi:hypothetical protein